MVKFKVNIPNGRWCMHPEPAPADRGRDEDPVSGVPEPVEYEAVAWEPVVTRPDPMSEEDQQALLGRWPRLPRPGSAAQTFCQVRPPSEVCNVALPWTSQPWRASLKASSTAVLAPSAEGSRNW